MPSRGSEVRKRDGTLKVRDHTKRRTKAHWIHRFHFTPSLDTNEFGSFKDIIRECFAKNASQESRQPKTKPRETLFASHVCGIIVGSVVNRNQTRQSPVGPICRDGFPSPKRASKGYRSDNGSQVIRIIRQSIFELQSQRQNLIQR